jgi:3'-phosphoadenosine 5'-phosphosulfate sulfotransferase (PAPS reductase)/FAD synthetase
MMAENAEAELLVVLVREFFEDYLDVKEESDSGRVFNPITISCCRCMKVEPLGKLLKKMRQLSGAK